MPEALARSIMADPHFETTQPVPVSIAGIDGLQMDVMVSEDNLCYEVWAPEAGDPGFRMRLYLVDHPGESAQVLTIAVIAPETAFERLLDQATPILESVEFHPG